MLMIYLLDKKCLNKNGMNMSNLDCGTGSPFMYIFLQTAGIFRASWTMVDIVIATNLSNLPPFAHFEWTEMIWRNGVNKLNNKIFRLEQWINEW